MKYKNLSFLIGVCLSCLIHAQTTEIEDLNSYDGNGKTPLLVAVSKNDYTQVENLLKKGASVNQPEEKGLRGSPLMYASASGYLKICKLLLANHADVNQVDVNNDPALNWAAFSGQKTVLSLLLKYGADETIKSKHGTALDVAQRLWHHDSVSRVFENSKLAKPLSSKEKQFIEAYRQNDSLLMLKLLTKGVSPNIKDALGIPVLQLAAQSGNLEMVELLVHNGVDVNITNRVGQSALSWAARFSQKEIATYLLKKSASANALDTMYQLTPLIGAAIGGSKEIGELLLDNGAEINHKDVINNANALHWSIFYNNKELGRLLILKGIHYHKKALENDSSSAYDMAKLYKREELVKLMDSIDHDTRKTKLPGSWRVHEIQYIYPDTTYIVNNGNYGRFLFTDTYYSLMYNPRLTARVPFKELSKPSEDEIVKAFNSIVFNSGTYVLNTDSTLVTKADLAKVPGFESGQQYYKINLINDELEITMYDETYPNGSKPEWSGNLEVKFIATRE